MTYTSKIECLGLPNEHLPPASSKDRIDAAEQEALSLGLEVRVGKPGKPPKSAGSTPTLTSITRKHDVNHTSLVKRLQGALSRRSDLGAELEPCVLLWCRSQRCALPRTGSFVVWDAVAK